MADHYCVSGDLSKRLTAAGLVYVGDRDDSNGAVSGTELAAYVDSAIEQTDTEIDAAIQLQYDTAAARGNTWLKWIAVDLATVRAITNGGREAPAAMIEERDRVRKELERIRNGELTIPGLEPLIPQVATADVRTMTIADLT